MFDESIMLDFAGPGRQNLRYEVWWSLEMGPKEMEIHVYIQGVMMNDSNPKQPMHIQVLRVSSLKITMTLEFCDPPNRLFLMTPTTFICILEKASLIYPPWN